MCKHHWYISGRCFGLTTHELHQNMCISRIDIYMVNKLESLADTIFNSTFIMKF